MRRKRPRSSKVMFVMAALVAAVATLVLRSHLLRLEEAARAAGPGARVVVVEADLARGDVLQESSLSVRSIPARFVPPGALGSVEQAAGRMLASDVLAGEPLTEARLAARGGPVAALVPPGLRAAPVAVAAPPGLLAAGDRVDVLATFAGGQPHTETIVSGAEVLSVLPANEFEGLMNVILLVSPETAESLAYARTLADLSVAVSSPDDPY